MKYNGRLAWFAFFALFLFTIPQITHANNGQTYEVHSNLLNIRSEPSPDAEVIGWLTKGDTVTTFKEHYGWVQTYYGGEEVWVAKHHLVAVGSAEETTTTESASESSASTTGTITVTADGVWIRQGPSTAHAVITSANAGNQYKHIQTEGDWHQITLENGESGWIASWMTDLTTGNPEATKTVAQTESVQANSVNGSLSGYTIVIDPGHGGHDPGAIGLGGIYEKNIVSSTANTVANHLRQAGAQVIETRSGDYFVPLGERAQISNSYYTDAFISIHYDAYPILTMQGVTAYYYGNSGYELAQSLQHSLASTTSLHNRGVMFGNYKVLRDTVAPAALLELGFITNSYDLSVVQTEDYQNTVAQAITDGLISYFQ